MNIIIFVVVLGILVFVHELGHFLFAKLFGVRVDEFGFGYPPRMLKIGKWRETDITFNWIPFGGFVRLFGEADNGEELSTEEQSGSLLCKPRWQQFLVMAGGIIFNIIFAWVLFTGSYVSGIRTSIVDAPAGYQFDSTEFMVTTVQADSPAEEAGLLAGDVILEYGTPDSQVVVTDQGIEDLSVFVNQAGVDNQELYLVVTRDGSLEAINLTPKEGVVENRYAIGVGADRVGELKLPFFTSVWFGLKNTIGFIGVIVESFVNLLTGHISLNAVSGPVGIVGQVGQASTLGLVYLVAFSALLSLNLAVINAFPFPALDGGRIIVILIESVIRRRLNPKAVNWVNAIGFFILIALMVVVTIKDVLHLVS